ncbi:MAG: hypothetical protein HY817_01840 [Candidatus Abawacabacteria bacterium]|nr:hypothetical protein [Candidatus Abawacabacteria bacterium]
MNDDFGRLALRWLSGVHYLRTSRHGKLSLSVMAAPAEALRAQAGAVERT